MKDWSLYMNKHNLDTTEFELDEIESIELVGERETVDITVEDTHMFFANDIYSHNSSLEDDVIEAGKIADSYAKVMHSDFIISLSRKSNDKLANTARIHIMKNRFGPDGMTFPSKMDTNTGTVEIFEENSPNGILIEKEAQNGNTEQKKNLYKKYKQLTSVDEKKAKSSLG